jgi:hypothetical protein
MIVVIPTNDGISIAPRLEEARLLRLLEIERGQITREKAEAFSGRKIDDLLSEFMTEEKSKSDNLNVIFGKEGSLTDKKISAGRFSLFCSEDSNIINALMHYLKDNASNVSDYCCQP